MGCAERLHLDRLAAQAAGTLGQESPEYTPAWTLDGCGSFSCHLPVCPGDCAPSIARRERAARLEAERLDRIAATTKEAA